MFGPLPCGGVCIPFSVPEAQDMLIYLCEEIFGFDGSGGEWWEGIGIKGNIVLVGVHNGMGVYQVFHGGAFIQLQ